MDALKVELRLLGVDKSIADMRRVASEMQRLQQNSGMGGGGAYQRQINQQQYVQRQETQQARAMTQLGTQIKQMAQGSGKSPDLRMAAAAAEMAGAGRLAAIFSEVAGPVALAVSAISGLEAAARSASEEMRAFRSAKDIGGGTREETGRAAAIGRQFGMDGERVAQDAREFSDRITRDPYAMNYAGRHGIHDIPGPYGEADKIKGLLKEIDALRNIRSDDEARREAFATGTEKYLGVRQMSQNNYDNMKAISNINSGGMSDRELRADANRTAADQNFKEVLGGIWNEVGRTWTRDKEWIIGRLMPKEIREAHDRNLYGGGQPERAQTAMDRHTAAMEAHTQALLNPGVYGGGDRTRGAVPGAFTPDGRPKPEWAQKQLRAQATALGAFSL